MTTAKKRYLSLSPLYARAWERKVCFFISWSNCALPLMVQHAREQSDITKRCTQVSNSGITFATYLHNPTDCLTSKCNHSYQMEILIIEFKPIKMLLSTLFYLFYGNYMWFDLIITSAPWWCCKDCGRKLHNLNCHCKLFFIHSVVEVGIEKWNPLATSK